MMSVSLSVKSFILLIFIFSTYTLGQINGIEGVVYSPERIPLNDVNIELLSDTGSLLRTVRTSGGGRFSFRGISKGRFSIRILPYKYNFKEEYVTVEVGLTGNGRAGDIVFIDIGLSYDKRKVDIWDGLPADIIFAQEIPEKARELYNKGKQAVSKNPASAITDFEKSIEIFPDYYDALIALGKSYYSQGKLSEAYPHLLKAVEINPRSTAGYLILAYTFYGLNEIEAAKKASNAVIYLSPNLSEGFFINGILLRVSGEYKTAEENLLKAISLSKNPNPEIYWHLSLLYNKTKRNKEAAASLEKYLKLTPDNLDKEKIKDLIKKLKASEN